MTATSHTEFNEKTQGLDVAKAFAKGIKGKTVLVTGVNKAGIGFTTAQAFASQSPAHLIVAGRNLARLQDSIDAIKAQYPSVDCRPFVVDLGNQKAVRAAAAELLSWADIPSIDIIVNSAGIMLLPERTINEDGIELHFATNHIGHYLLTCLLMPKLLAAAKGSPKGATRIINVTSGSPQMARMRWSDRNFEKVNKTLPENEQPIYAVHKIFGSPNSEELAYVPLEGYNQSKVANVLFSIAANKRLFEKHGILSLAVHPGVIQTELARVANSDSQEAIAEMRRNKTFTYKTLDGGASTSMVAALDPKLGLPEDTDASENHGIYLVDCQISDNAQPLAVSSSEAEKLWALSEELVKESFSW